MIRECQIAMTVLREAGQNGAADMIGTLLDRVGPELVFDDKITRWGWAEMHRYLERRFDLYAVAFNGEYYDVMLEGKREFTIK